jgi:hypothetical protein
MDAQVSTGDAVDVLVDQFRVWLAEERGLSPATVLIRQAGAHVLAPAAEATGYRSGTVGFGAGHLACAGLLLPRPQHVVGEGDGDLGAGIAEVPTCRWEGAVAAGGSGALGGGMAAGVATTWTGSRSRAAAAR